MNELDQILEENAKRRAEERARLQEQEAETFKIVNPAEAERQERQRKERIQELKDLGFATLEDLKELQEDSPPEEDNESES